MASFLHFILIVSVGLLAATARADDDDECPPTCPPLWTQFGTRCFLFQLNQTTWINSETNCIAAGGNLASLHGSSDSEFIVYLVYMMTGGYTPVWLGGHDSAAEGTWQWTDGSYFQSSVWSLGQPDNVNGSQHCMQMNELGHFAVHDVYCFQYLSSVCTKDM